MIREEVNIAANVESGKIDINDSAVRDTVNSLIEGVTNQCFLTPYIALERVAKVLANFHIYLPRYTFMEGDSGLATFPVHQFGEKVGMTNDGQVITKATSPYTLWFEYQMNDKGTYEVFCAVVDGDELRDLMGELNTDLDEAVVHPETGPRKVPGSASDTGVEREEEDQTSTNMPELIKAIIRRTMKPGIKFAGDEAGGKEKPSTSLSESKKKSLSEDARADAIARFKSVHGTAFDPKSRTDISKLNQMVGDKTPTTASVPMPTPRPKTPTVAPTTAPAPRPTQPGTKTSPTATAYSPITKDTKNKTMQGGPVDTKGERISTLTDYIKTGKPVTVAVDKKSPQFGKTGQIDVNPEKGFSFKQHDPSAEGGVVNTTVFTPKGQGIPVKASDTGGAFKGKGDTRVDIPAQADAPDKVTWQQPYSKQKVDISWNQEPKKTQVASLDENIPSDTLGEKPKPAQWNLEEDDEPNKNYGASVVPKTNSTQAPTQATREKGIQGLKNAMNQQKQDKMNAYVDQLKKQDFFDRKTEEPPKKGQHDI